MLACPVMGLLYRLRDRKVRISFNCLAIDTTPFPAMLLFAKSRYVRCCKLTIPSDRVCTLESFKISVAQI